MSDPVCSGEQEVLSAEEPHVSRREEKLRLQGIMNVMFFRRERPRNPTFADRLENLRKAGFMVSPVAGGRVRVRRDVYAIDLTDADGAVHSVGTAGILMGDEIGVLVDGGFQKFFQTPSGKKKPALADELKTLHEFEEDLKEALGQESY
jgi:hypothetical protein